MLTCGVIAQNSKSADLIITGFRSEAMKEFGADIFMCYVGVANVLFVNAQEEKEIK